MSNTVRRAFEITAQEYHAPPKGTTQLSRRGVVWRYEQPPGSACVFVWRPSTRERWVCHCTRPTGVNKRLLRALLDHLAGETVTASEGADADDAGRKARRFVLRKLVRHEPVRFPLDEPELSFELTTGSSRPSATHSHTVHGRMSLWIRQRSIVAALQPTAFVDPIVLECYAAARDTVSRQELVLMALHGVISAHRFPNLPPDIHKAHRFQMFRWPAWTDADQMKHAYITGITPELRAAIHSVGKGLVCP